MKNIKKRNRYSKLFQTDPDKLNKMIAMASGERDGKKWSDGELATFFHCDRSTITNQRIKNNIPPPGVFSIKKNKNGTFVRNYRCAGCGIPFTTKSHNRLFHTRECGIEYRKKRQEPKNEKTIIVKNEVGERINQGKNYQNYLREAYGSRADRILKNLQWRGLGVKTLAEIMEAK